MRPSRKVIELYFCLVHSIYGPKETNYVWKQKSELIAAGLTASQIQLAARLANEFGGALGFESFS